MKKVFCLALCVLLLLPTAVYAGAQDSAEGTLRVIAYNVSGIPLVGDFQGTKLTTTKGRAAMIGRLLNGTGADFVGTEEDFNAHKYLAAEMTDYPYRSFTSGGVAQGQGLNVFSTHPLFNVTRVRWEKEYGYLSGSMDAISNKGFLYALMALDDETYIHMINVHMDAGYDCLSVRARADNFRQLASFINENCADGRALIVQGDFNYKFKRKLSDDLTGNLLEPTGLRDVWVELSNNGIYDLNDPAFDFASEGDDLDRILYRSGTDLTLTPVSKTVPHLTGENGEQYSDHNPMLTEFRFAHVGRISTPQTLREQEPEDETLLTVREIGWACLRFLQALIGLVELPYLAWQAIDLLVHGKMP